MLCGCGVVGPSTLEKNSPLSLENCSWLLGYCWVAEGKCCSRRVLLVFTFLACSCNVKVFKHHEVRESGHVKENCPGGIGSTKGSKSNASSVTLDSGGASSWCFRVTMEENESLLAGPQLHKGIGWR
ncbi:uncharacterized protein G2W53_003607 [Senna tora]|uniref:Uncharacterized protein n=1 Tax=Senna tora TaxID=362788 RepID=A0A834XBU3_9FABA|nr:uncharacterized protein G2W53_003607 [Senna tora]